MISIFHLLWISPLCIMLGFAISAFIYLQKDEQQAWDEIVFDEEWDALFEEE